MTATGWKKSAGTVGGAILGLVLLVAAATKVLDPVGFAEVIEREGVALLGSPFATALVALVLEVGLGVALVLGVRRREVLVPTTALVVFFVFLTGRAYWRSLHGAEISECGCFGSLVERTPAEAFWQDLALLVPTLALAWIGRGDPRPARGRIALAAGLAAATLLFAWWAPALPLDDLATRLRPGVEVAQLCAGADAESRICLDALVPELEEGRHLVVVSPLDAAPLEDRIDALNDYALDGGDATLWVVTPAPPEEVQAFRWQWAPAFEVREAPAELLRPLYREPPRSFLVESGEVVATWAGVAPLPPDRPDPS